MKRKLFVWILIGGAALAALSFLFGGIDNETVQSIRWAIFVFGLICALSSVAILIAGIAKKDKRKLLPDGAEYRRKKTLMTPPEVHLYHSLRSLLDARKYLVLPQMALVSVVDKVSGGGYRNELFRVPDFCIVDATTFEPLLIIELNDASHNREERKLRDDKVAAICEDAGMPLMTLTLAEADDERLIKSELKKRL